MTGLAPLLQAFFTDRLAAQRHASPHTVLSYRDAFRLLLDYTASTTGKKPSTLDIADLDAPLIASFLDHLERDPTTARAPATTGWLRSIRCSATRPCTTPSMPTPSRASSRSRSNATTARC
jgi:site-specific recombinase XerC